MQGLTCPNCNADALTEYDFGIECEKCKHNYDVDGQYTWTANGYEGGGNYEVKGIANTITRR